MMTPVRKTLKPQIPVTPNSPLSENDKGNLAKKISLKLKEADKGLKKDCEKYFSSVLKGDMSGFPEKISKRLKSFCEKEDLNSDEKEGFNNFEKLYLQNSYEHIRSALDDGKEWSSDRLTEIATICKIEVKPDFVRLHVKEGKVVWAYFSASENAWFKPEKKDETEIQNLKKIEEGPAEKDCVDLSPKHFMLFKGAGKRNKSKKETKLILAKKTTVVMKRRVRKDQTTQLFDVDTYENLTKNYKNKKIPLECDHMPQTAWILNYRSNIIKTVEESFKLVETLSQQTNTNISSLKEFLENIDFLKNIEESYIDTLTGIPGENNKIIKPFKIAVEELLSSEKVQKLKKICDKYKDKGSGLSGSEKSEIATAAKSVKKSLSTEEELKKYLKKYKNPDKKLIKNNTYAMAINKDKHKNSRTHGVRVKKDRLHFLPIKEFRLDQKYYFEHTDFGSYLKNDLIKAIGAFRYHYKLIVKQYGYYNPAHDKYFVNLLRQWKNEHKA